MKGEWLVESRRRRVARGAARHRRPGSVRFDGLHACGFNAIARSHHERGHPGGRRRERVIDPEGMLRNLDMAARHTMSNCHIGVYEEGQARLWQIVTITHR